MVEYVYTTVPGKIKPLLAKIREVGIPARVTTKWMSGIGFKSSNDGSLIGVMKFIGLVDAGGLPTPSWKNYRGSNYKSVLGSAIRDGYSDLFHIYNDANLRSNDELSHVFSTSSSAGKQAISKTVATFKALADEAEFAQATHQPEIHSATPAPHALASEAHLQPTMLPAQVAPMAAQSLPGASLHIDIQIHISPESSGDQIDQIFASMAKHLYHHDK